MGLQVGSLLKVLSLLAAASIKDVHPSHVFGPHPTWTLAATSASGMSDRGALLVTQSLDLQAQEGR